MDTHADVHVAAALDPIGGLLGVQEFPATPEGYGRLLGWLGGFGTVSLVVDFPDQTVWSDFGSGYGFVPLVLPMFGMWWLWRTRPRDTSSPPSGTAETLP